MAVVSAYLFFDISNYESTKRQKESFILPCIDTNT